MSDQPKHTPGPWRVQKQRTQGRAGKEADWRGIYADRFPVVDCDEYSTNMHGEWETVSGVRIREADAALIAAAPDLLQAVKDLLWQIEELDPQAATFDFPNRARASIAKAEGKQP